MYTTHALSPKDLQRHHRYSSETPKLYQNDIAMRTTSDVIGGKTVKSIAVSSQSITGMRAINPLFSRLLRHLWNKWRCAILLFWSGHHTRKNLMSLNLNSFDLCI
jgi:hypothetical protein